MLRVSRFPADYRLGDLDMGDKRWSLDASVNEKATLTTSRRNFIAGWKLCAGVALGLCLAGRSSSAQNSMGNNNNNMGNNMGKVPPVMWSEFGVARSPVT
jgi:hypothetical protein